MLRSVIATLIVLAATSFVVPAFAANSRTPGLVTGVASSCATTTTLGFFKCERLSRAFARAVDFDSLSGSPKAILIFKTKTLEIARDPRFIPYLKALDREFEKPKLFDPTPVDVFHFTSQYLKSPNEALKWVGLIFQDNTYDYHFHWLERSHALSPETFELWHHVAEHAHYRELTHPDGRTIHLFPSGITSRTEKLSFKPYYFYLVLLAKQEMLKTASAADVDEFLMFIVLRYTFRRVHEGTWTLIWGGLPIVETTGRSLMWLQQFTDVYTSAVALNAFSIAQGRCRMMSESDLKQLLLTQPQSIFARGFLTQVCRSK